MRVVAFVYQTLTDSLFQHMLNFSESISILLNTYKKDFGAVQAWESINWSGVCDKHPVLR